jgi:hypothetical protein
VVYRWRCRTGMLSLWAASADAAAEAIRSHLLDYAESNLRRGDLRTMWRCPHCEAEGRLTRATVRWSRSNHTCSATWRPGSRPVPTSRTPVGGTGSVLLLAPLDGDASANARAHFLSRVDAAVVVTADPTARLRLLDRKLHSWPASTTLVTTAAEPLPGLDFDPPAELAVVTVDGQPDLSGVGKTAHGPPLGRGTRHALRRVRHPHRPGRYVRTVDGVSLPPPPLVAVLTSESTNRSSGTRASTPS